jgi:hypothetical protein
MRQAAARLGRPGAAVVADAGFDTDAAPRLCHRAFGLRRTAIRLNPRPAHGTRRWPTSRYRRAMRRRFPWRVYRRRSQVESVISRDKRRLGSALTARQSTAQASEALLRVLTHTLMILHHASISFQRSRSDPAVLECAARPDGLERFLARRGQLGREVLAGIDEDVLLHAVLAVVQLAVPAA